MLSIKKCPGPANTMLEKYSTTDGAYTDCYITEVTELIAFPQFITAFYTTPLFRLERLILKVLVSKPSTDMDVRQLAEGNAKTFAAWTVENRSENQLLMCDFLGRTRSWLMIVPVDDSRTRLYFGSAVVPIRNSKTGKPSLGFNFQALLGFHKIYSRLLLYSAKLRIKRRLSKQH
jgi:hypothetical protein